MRLITTSLVDTKVQMASIDDYFSIDSKHNVTVQSESSLSVNDVELPIRMFHNLAVGAYYFTIRIPIVDDVFQFCLGLIHGNLVEAVERACPNTIIWSRCPTSHGVSTAELSFCGRVYMYSQAELTKPQVESIYNEGRKKGLFVEYYGPSWAKERSEMEKPLAFISHDSRDKAKIARPLALELSGQGVRVWFDEFALKIGDSLRESIERGLRETDFCVLILTKNFLSNEGWSKTEFDSVFTREIIQKQKLFLPVWHDVTPAEVYEYSPSLADRMAVNWKDGKEKVATKIKQKVKPSV